MIPLSLQYKKLGIIKTVGENFFLKLFSEQNRGRKNSPKFQKMKQSNWIFPLLILPKSFNNLAGMQWPNPFRRRRRDGKIPTTSGEATSGRNFEFPTSHERHIPIPHTWFSRRGGNIIPTTRGEASSGRNYISTTTAKPQVGNWDVP